MKKYFCAVVIYLFCISAFAAEDYYRFETPQQESRFDDLTGSLRCLVCQNETLAESGAPLAEDLRHEIYEKVLAGQSNRQIVSYLTKRYGDFILYSPPLTLMTFALWFGPILLLVMGVGYLVFYVKKNRRVAVRHGNGRLV
jgi:cytochrome c-type biogenesis protein CcmH